MKFKTKKVEERYKFSHPLVKEIDLEADKFLQENYKKELMITETATTIEEDKFVGRKAGTHRDRPCRSSDWRTRDLLIAERAALIAHINAKYGHLGAISASTKKPNLLVDRPHGTGPHIHTQIKRGIK